MHNPDYFPEMFEAYTEQNINRRASPLHEINPRGASGEVYNGLVFRGKTIVGDTFSVSIETEHNETRTAGGFDGKLGRPLFYLIHRMIDCNDHRSIGKNLILVIDPLIALDIRSKIICWM